MLCRSWVSLHEYLYLWHTMVMFHSIIRYLSILFHLRQSGCTPYCIWQNVCHHFQVVFVSCLQLLGSTVLLGKKSVITWHTIPYHIIYHISYIIYHISYIIYHISYIICHMSYVICHMSYVICHISYIIYHISYHIISHHIISHHIISCQWQIFSRWELGKDL